MGYSDQKFYDRPLVLIADGQLGTGTASAAGVGANLQDAPLFIRRTTIPKLVLICNVVSKVTTTHLVILNGTSTAVDVTIGTFTAGQQGTATLSAAFSTFAAGTGPTFKGTATYTASGDTTGSFQIFAECQELP